MSIGFKQTSHIIEDSKPRVHGYLGIGPVSSDCHLESLDELAKPPEVAPVSACSTLSIVSSCCLAHSTVSTMAFSFVAFSPACRVA